MCSTPNTPEYFTLLSVCPYDGSTTVLGIFENLDAVTYRLKSAHTSCGDEYRIECFHLTTAEDAAKRYNDLVVSRLEAQKAREEKEEEVKA